MKKILILVFILFFLLNVNVVLAGYCVCSNENITILDENQCNNSQDLCSWLGDVCSCEFEIENVNNLQECLSNNKYKESLNWYDVTSFSCQFEEANTGDASGGSTTGDLPGGAIPPKETSSNSTAESIKLPNFLNTDDPNVIIGRVIKYMIGLSGSAALLMFIYGGFLWLTSQGKAENVQKGKNAMIYSTIGLVIIFSSYIIVRFIISAITGTN